MKNETLKEKINWRSYRLAQLATRIAASDDGAYARRQSRVFKRTADDLLEIALAEHQATWAARAASGQEGQGDG